jgi:integrase/recombinase XerD
VERGVLRVVAGGAAAEAVYTSPDPAGFQEECLRAFEASQVARGFSELTIVNGGGTLQRFLDACGRPAWEVMPEDIDRVVGDLAAQGLAASTRRGYVQAFKNFHAFLLVRKAAEIEAAFGVRIESPVDEFNAARHVSADSPASDPPPGPERLEDFFGFLRERIAGARKYAVAGRDYALFRTLYLAGLRADEAAMMDRADVHFGRGPFGKLHVRFGKGAKTSGPRPRWVPMLDGLDLILRWYLDEIRPRMGDSPPAALSMYTMLWSSASGKSRMMNDPATPGCAPTPNGIAWIVTFGSERASRRCTTCSLITSRPPMRRRSAASSMIAHTFGALSLTSKFWRSIRAATRISMSCSLACSKLPRNCARAYASVCSSPGTDSDS